MPVPAACYTCSCIAYCSRRCRDADAQKHLRECRLLPVLWHSKASVTCFLALKSITQRPFEEVIELKKRLGDGASAFKICPENPYLRDDYMTFYNLGKHVRVQTLINTAASYTLYTWTVTHEDKRLPEDIFHRACMAAWLFRLLKSSDYLPENVKTADSPTSRLSDEELFIAGLLLHNLELLQFNSHEVTHDKT